MGHFKQRNLFLGLCNRAGVDVELHAGTCGVFVCVGQRHEVSAEVYDETETPLRWIVTAHGGGRFQTCLLSDDEVVDFLSRFD